MFSKFKIGLKCTWVMVLAFGLSTSLTMAKERFLLEGIFDLEAYETDANSRLLSRNDGDIASIGRLQLWSAYQISSGFQIYALGEIEVDDSSGERETEMEIEQFALRYSTNSAPNYYLEAGKLLSPVGAFAGRRLSTLNPLIGQPDIYDTSYPWAFRWLDRLAGSIIGLPWLICLSSIPITCLILAPISARPWAWV